jgi:hypothetical protein
MVLAHMNQRATVRIRMHCSTISNVISPNGWREACITKKRSPKAASRPWSASSFANGTTKPRNLSPWSLTTAARSLRCQNSRINHIMSNTQVHGLHKAGDSPCCSITILRAKFMVEVSTHVCIFGLTRAAVIDETAPYSVRGIRPVDHRIC